MPKKEIFITCIFPLLFIHEDFNVMLNNVHCLYKILCVLIQSIILDDT